jgi:hypothetical protein
MRSYKKPQKVTSEGDLQGLEGDLPELDEAGGELAESCNLPWESSEEFERFRYFLRCPLPRSVRKAYRQYCAAQGRKPRKDPPSSWYRLHRGEYGAIRLAEQRQRAIERAEKVHGLTPDWAGLEATARQSGEIGKYEGEIGKVWDSLTLIEWAFRSLAIDLHGDPLPGLPTWEERCAVQVLNEAGFQDFADVLLSRDAQAIRAALTPEIEALLLRQEGKSGGEPPKA